MPISKICSLSKGLFARAGDASAVVAVEAAFIFSLLVILVIAVTDYGFYLTLRSRAEAVNYSLTSVLRERTWLYDADEAVTQVQLDELAKLAGVMFGKTGAQQLCLTVEQIVFKDEKIKSVAASTIFFSGAANCRTQPITRLEALTELSPWSSASRWMPLYQVTLSVPTPENSLHKLLQGVGALPERIIISNVALPR
ncbi:tight adherence pilus pseudopilin TadF [Pantoea sp. CCBC3-3-1]|uniref:tight adherence pilus pseudopilin TadF n=1 Tax=Pantoea sp. CCBC3-3-1 TaxID=2490851 RepID=UPI00143D0915|nr:tight adherence pilus pseudopilin TadF [Pantoea sp. CCBC3-3-1]